LKANKIYCGDNRELIKNVPDNSIDMIATDTPYGINFMGKNWDKALPPLEIFQEMNRVLKPGAFCFCFSSPRQDVLWRMMQRLELAGFMIDLPSIYWTYATGIGLGQNVSKMIDKRLGKEREVVVKKSRKPVNDGSKANYGKFGTDASVTAPASDLAKEFDGAYIRYRPKSALEVILVTMKPVEKVFRSQIWEKHKIDYFHTEREKDGKTIIKKIAMNPALNDEIWEDNKLIESSPYKDTAMDDYLTTAIMNGKACTWLDRVRAPIQENEDLERMNNVKGIWSKEKFESPTKSGNNTKGRYPTNLLSSGNRLDTGEEHNSGELKKRNIRDKGIFKWNKEAEPNYKKDSGSFNRYFDFDAWARECLPKTYPFLPVAKPTAGHKKGREAHLTEKPPQIFAYLITLASRPGDIVADFFGGSGSCAIAAAALNRDWIYCDIEQAHCDIARQRLSRLTVQREERELV
jgi:DNA modification methylase